MYHNNTIRRYTSALLNVFNDIEIQNFDSKNNRIVKKIPILYSPKEKSFLLDKLETEQITKGNLNVIPRARLSLTSIQRAEDRMTNKFNHIVDVNTKNGLQFSYNAIPYDVFFDITVLCRGMNEACMILEQIAPKFNPTLNLDIYDTDYLEDPTRVMVKLLDINFEGVEYDETSLNLVSVVVSLSLSGYLYQPLKEFPKISQFIINFDTNQERSDSISGWDVVNKEPQNQECVYDDGKSTFKIIDMVAENVLRKGENQFDLIIEDTKFVISSYQWEIKAGNVKIDNKTLKNPKIKISGKGDFILSCKVTDKFGNYLEFEKKFSY